jgi:hypothetical protein
VNRSPLLVLHWLVLVVKGNVTEDEGRPALRVLETNELFLLADGRKDRSGVPTPLAKLLAATGSGSKAVLVTGRIEPLRGPRSPHTRRPDRKRLVLTVTDFKAAEQ